MQVRHSDFIYRHRGFEGQKLEAAREAGDFVQIGLPHESLIVGEVELVFILDHSFKLFHDALLLLLALADFKLPQMIVLLA